MKPTSWHYRPERSKGPFNGKIRVANESYAPKMSTITVVTHSSKFTPSPSLCNALKETWVLTVRVTGLKYGIFGHWLSEASTLEMKNSHSDLVFTHNTIASEPEIITKPQNDDFCFQRAAIEFVVRQSSICNWSIHVFESLNE